METDAAWRPPPAPGPWQTATVKAVWPETAHVKTFRLGLEHPTPYLAGQHFVVRLRAPDGYTAQRSYSVASPPDGSAVIELTVERLPDGEVSTFLHDEVVVGDRLEVRGPIGGYFTWDGGSRALLLGGGIGLVPLWSMLRLARTTGRAERVRLVASVRSPEDLPYARELPGPEVDIAYTRRAPAGFARPVGRLGPDDLTPALSGDPTVYVCGSAGFADHATDLLAGLGVASGRIQVERFGATS